MAVVQEAVRSLSDSLWGLWDGLIKAVPGVLAAIVILVLGYFVSVGVEWLVRKILDQAKADVYLIDKTNLSKVFGKLSLSYVLSVVSKWLIFMLFLASASEVVSLTPLANFLEAVAAWIPVIIGASLLGLFGVVASDYVRQRIEATKIKNAELVAGFVKTVLLVFTAVFVLAQIGFDVTILQGSLFIVVAGAVFALALGFGLALKDEAKTVIKDVRRKL